ncbi:hypothetical protein DFJ77DRAFT_251446 [Powellomyces hirtus]|nr:hypothetical protein DFJ77DRAFT_251446 [Powellomyces hirtus]
MRATPVWLSTAALCVLAVDASPPTYNFIKPAQRYAERAWAQLQDIDVKGIVEGTVQLAGLKPFEGGRIVPACLQNETYAYSVNNTVMVTAGGDQISTSGLTATVFLSCLTSKTTGGATEKEEAAHVFDLQVRDVTLLPSDKQADTDFSLPFQMIRSVSGSIVGVQIDTREKPQIAAIKKSIAENFQTRFEYGSNGAAVVYEKGAMALRNTRYMAVTDSASDKVAIRAKYENKDVERFMAAKGSNPDAEVAFVANTNAILDRSGLIRETLDRTHATLTGADEKKAEVDDADINVHGGSDVVFLKTIERLDTGVLQPVSPATGLQPRSEGEFDTVRVSQAVALDGSLLTVPATAAPVRLRHRAVPDLAGPQFREEELGSADVPAISYDFNDIMNGFQQDTAAGSTLATRAARDAKASAIAQFVSHARQVLIERREEGPPRVTNTLVTALAATGDAEAHAVLVDLALGAEPELRQSARHALIFARAASPEIVRRVAAAHDESGDLALVLGALLEHQSADVARRYMAPLVARAEGNAAAQMSILHAVANMGANAAVVKRDILGWMHESTDNLEVRAAVTDALAGTFSVLPASSSTHALARRDAETTSTLSTEWEGDSHAHDLIAARADRQADVARYSSRRGFIAGKSIGWKQLNLDLAAGAFAGSDKAQCGGGAQKLMARVRGNIRAFGKTAQVADIGAHATRDGVDGLSTGAFVRLAGKTIAEIKLDIPCEPQTIPLVKEISTPVFPLKVGFPIYVAMVDIGIEVSASVAVDVVYRICGPEGTSYSAGSIAVMPKVTGTVAGSAGVSILGLRGGLELAGTASVAMGPEARFGDMPPPKNEPLKLAARGESHNTKKKCSAARSPETITQPSVEIYQTAAPVETLAPVEIPVEAPAESKPVYGTGDEAPATSANDSAPAPTAAPTATDSEDDKSDIESVEPVTTPEATQPIYGQPPVVSTIESQSSSAESIIENAEPTTEATPEPTATLESTPTSEATIEISQPVYGGKQEAYTTPSSEPTSEADASSTVVMTTELSAHSSDLTATPCTTTSSTTASEVVKTSAASEVEEPTTTATPAESATTEVTSTPCTTTSTTAPTMTASEPAQTSSTTIVETAVETSTSSSDIATTPTEEPTATTTLTNEPTATSPSTTRSEAEEEPTSSAPVPSKTATPEPPAPSPAPKVYKCQACVSLQVATDGAKIELAGTFQVLIFKKKRKVFWSKQIAPAKSTTVKGADVCLPLFEAKPAAPTTPAVKKKLTGNRG